MLDNSLEILWKYKEIMFKYYINVLKFIRKYSTIYHVILFEYFQKKIINKYKQMKIYGHNVQILEKVFGNAVKV